MELSHEIHKNTFTPKTIQTIGTLHTHLKELDSHISSFETSMLISKYPDTSHMSKLERNIAVLQHYLKPMQK